MNKRVNGRSQIDANHWGIAKVKGTQGLLLCLRQTSLSLFRNSNKHSSCEREFSKNGNNITDKHNCLDPKDQQLLFSRENYHLYYQDS
jgi:hypothetical protein